MTAATVLPDSDPDLVAKPRRRIPWPLIRLVSCWALVAVFTLLAIVRIFGLERTWYVDTFIAFTPYICVLSVVPLLFALVLRRWRAATVAVLVSFALVSVFVSRAIGEPDPGPGPRLHVMSSNMKLGGADPTTIVGLVRSHQIDLLAIEEYTPDAQRALQGDGLLELLPYHAETPISGAIGSAIYSRYPLSATGYRNLAGGFGQEYATVAVPGAPPLLFEAVHTRAPAVPGTQGYWARSIAEQPTVSPHGPLRLLAGDFNATLDHADLRRLLDTGYIDVASQLGDGLTTTWPYDGRLIPPITIDHMFADPRIGAISFGASKVPGTDHRAIFAELTLPVA